MRKQRALNRIKDYLWIAPVLVVITLLMLYPLLRTLWLSFQDKSPGGEAVFTGLRNFVIIFQRGIFVGAFLRTFLFTIPAIAMKLLLGMAAALILNRSFRGRNMLRSFLFIPWTIPLFAGGILFIWIFRMNGGLNLILLRLGLKPVFWLGPLLAMPSVISLNIWKGFPFFMVGILAGLQVIPKDLYEASAIDGATGIQQFFYVTLPGLRDVVLIVTILSTIWTFAQFENIYIMTGGGPGTATEVLSVSVYNHAFTRYNFPVASAIAVTALPVFLALIIWLTLLVRREYEG
ncbi:MAG: sugar ABC transporter permease [Spirochaetales bacterium]|nr:sugar ABC transporter permease [Spirochaetales bacterium]